MHISKIVFQRRMQKIYQDALLLDIEHELFFDELKVLETKIEDEC